MIRTRRDFGKLALALLPMSTLIAKQDSKWGGVQVGINAPYSFRDLSGKADKIRIPKADRPERFGAAASARRGVVRRAGGLCLSGRYAERECGGGTGRSNWACFDDGRAGRGEEIERVAYLAVDGKDQGLPEDV